MSQDNRSQEEVPEETLPSEEYPRAYDQLDLIVRSYGTDWVRRAVDEIYEAIVNE